MRSRKSWREKMEAVSEPRLVDDARSGGKMLIPRPLDVEALIRQVPKGKLCTTADIRARLAREHNADITCPLTIGIFLRIVAEAAEEELAGGKAQVTPYWRVVKEDGSLNPKFPGGAESQAARLRSEGHIVLSGSDKKPPRVQNLTVSLQRL